MNYNDLKKKWLWKSVDFDWVYWSQCVDFARQWALDLHWVKIGWFSGSALNGWKTGSPFNKQWIRVTNTLNAIPPAWAVVFFDVLYKNWRIINPYGHVAITWDWCTQKKLVILEQNAWNGNWDGKLGNAIKESILDYVNPSRCLWWFVFNPNIKK